MASLFERVVDGLLFLVSPWLWTNVSSSDKMADAIEDEDEEELHLPPDGGGPNRGTGGVGARRPRGPRVPAGAAARHLEDEEAL